MMKNLYLTPATQAQSMIATQVFMTSPTGLGKGEDFGGTGPGDIIHIN